jgi:acyl carrier protein
MSEQMIYTVLTDIFRDVLDRQDLDLRPSLTAIEVPEWDSFAHVNIIVAAEMRFGVKFRTGELGELHNVGNFVTLIRSKLPPG